MPSAEKSNSKEDPFREAFWNTVRTITADMPLLMHGSGDVFEGGNPETQVRQFCSESVSSTDFFSLMDSVTLGVGRGVDGGIHG